MALLNTQTIAQAGTVPTMVAASSGGDTFQPSTTTVLMFVNSSGSAITATLAVTATAFGQPVQNVTITVNAGATVIGGPYDPAEVAQAATGLGSLTYSAVSGLTVAVLEV